MSINRPLIIVYSAASFILFMIFLIVYISINNLNSQIRQSKSMVQKMREEAVLKESEMEKVSKENEKLQADTVSYLGLNTKLQNEKAAMRKSLEDAQKLIENKEASLQRTKQRLDRIENELSLKRAKEFKSLTKEKNALTKKMAQLDSSLKKERALYHYNLGVAYAQAKMYDEAVGEYEKSLKIDNDNAEAHYNLALIYDTVNSDAANALSHYNKYLELKPNADDRDEVEASIRKLK